MVKMLERESVSISKLRTATLLFIHSLYFTVGSQLTHFWSREHTSSLLKQGKNPLRVWKWEEEKGLFCVCGGGGKKRDIFFGANNCREQGALRQQQVFSCNEVEV